jgi:CRISPR-associated endonuclease/helicase Cas3
MKYYAHTLTEDKSNWQSLLDHLQNTAILAQKFGKSAGVSEFAYIAAIFHDLGKYSLAFQKRLEGSNEHVDHTSAGAIEIRKLFSQTANQKMISTLLAYCIAGHHGGLLDYGSSVDTDDAGTLYARLHKEPKNYTAYAEEINLPEILFPERILIKPIFNHIGFSLSFFTRMIYSTLVDADFQETENFVRQGEIIRGGYPSIEELNRLLDNHLQQFMNPLNEINDQRTKTLVECIAKSEEEKGLFRLTVPTGGGKTLSSMAFAMKHAIRHHMERIIYVIPYTSIIDQNAAQFKRIFGEDNVLEHHSNFDWSPKEKKNTSSFDETSNTAIHKLRLASENWDIPIIVTTNVQFFESLFSNRSSKNRKLHNIANSVIIFDEAQMFSLDFMKPCLTAVFELTRNYGVSAVFCTATQPELEQFFPEEVKLREMIMDPPALYNFYKRVQVQYIGLQEDQVILSKMSEAKQALCIVNTRKHAKGLFSELNDPEAFHLSTLMCPVHRKKTILDVRARLIDKQPCKVISTQIMEAGIDVDFPVGFRALAGLDSIIQAAGRVNREKKYDSGTLFVFEPKSKHISKTPLSIQQSAAVAKKILQDYADPVCLQAIQAYYNELYANHKETAFDKMKILDYFDPIDMREINFAFKTVADEFRLIESNTVPLIIPFDENAKTLLDQLLITLFPLSIIRKLQLYTINIYEREFENLQNVGAIAYYLDKYAVLSKPEYYDKQTGVLIPENAAGEALFN